MKHIDDDKAIIIFSGYNMRALVAFIRTLEKNGIRYGIISKNKNDPIHLTVYAQKVLAIRSKEAIDRDDIIRSLNKVKKIINANKYIIAPSSEALNRYMLSNSDIFESLGCVVPLVDKRIYYNISDKKPFGDICRDNDILVPGEYQNISEAKIPFVAKPKAYYGSKGIAYSPAILDSVDSVGLFKLSHASEDFYYQEFIGGESLYILFYFYSDGTCDKFSQINKIQQPMGKSIIAAEVSDLHNKDETSKYEKMLARMGFKGLIMVEVKRYKDRYYMIEANPRFWGPSQLFVDANYNLFESFLFDNGFNVDKPNINSATIARYFWQGGIVHRDGKMQLTFHDYSMLDFEKEFNDWSGQDVFNRNDTRKLYEYEIRRQYESKK